MTSRGLSDSGDGGKVYVPADGRATIVVPDAAALFRGAYMRSGPDLTIVGPDGATIIVTDYFASETPADLHSPGGAILSGSVVAQLAGPSHPSQYAQVGGAAGAPPIGQVETLAGTATATRGDGRVDALQVGSPLFQGDVVATSAGANVSIAFADRTILTLGESSRLALDQFVYDAGGSSNSLLFNVIQGAFVFIAGQVAPTGDMRIETPVATIGVRGTTGVVRIISADGATVFTLVADPDGSLGAYDVLGKISGALLRALRSDGESVLVRNAIGDTEDPLKTPNEIALEQQLLALAVAAFQVLQLRIERGEPIIRPTDGEPMPPGPGEQPGPPGPPGPDGGQRGGSLDGEQPTQKAALDLPETAGEGEVAETSDPSSAEPVLEPIGETFEVALLGAETFNLVPLLPNEILAIANGDGAIEAQPSLELSDFGAGSPAVPPVLQPAPPPVPPPTPGGGGGAVPLGLTVPGVQAVLEDGAVVISGFAITGTGTLTVTVVAASTVTLASLTGLAFLTGDGTGDETLVFTGAAADINAALNGLTYFPTLNNDTTGGLTLTITDGTTTVTDAILVNITPVDDPPTLAGSIGARAVAANSAINFDANVFSNVDTGDTLTFSATLAGGAPLPAWLAFDPRTAVFTGTPTGGDFGSITVVVTATDSSGSSASETFTLTTQPDVVGSPGADTIFDNDPANNYIQGGIGNDNIVISSPDGIDIVEPGSGNDVVTGNGNTILSFATSGVPVRINLVSTAGFGQAVIQDLETGVITPLQTLSGETQTVDGVSSDNPLFSPDGTRVVFESTASLSPGAPSGTWQVYVKELATGAVTWISQTVTGALPNNNSLSSEFGARWSPDGNQIVYHSDATNLLGSGTDTNGMTDLFIKNLVTGDLIRVSTTSDGSEAVDTTPVAPNLARGSFNPSFSPDGTKLVFQSTATNLVSGDINGVSDIFLKDLVTGTVTLISIDANPGVASSGSGSAVFSPDGTRIAFASDGLLPGDVGGSDIYVYTLATGAMELASRTAAGTQVSSAFTPQFSPDGTKLLFNTLATLYVKDLVTGTLTPVSTNVDGVAATGASRTDYTASWSPDGTKIVFWSNAANLVAGDTNGFFDIYIKDLVTGEVTLVSVAGDILGNGNSLHPNFSPEGTLIAYETAANNLLPSGTTNVGIDKFSGIAGIWGSVFADTLIGVANNETFRGNAGADLIIGGGGVDEVDYSNSPTGILLTIADLGNGNTGFGTAQDGWGTVDTLRLVENVRGSPYADAITTDPQANTIWGGDGDDAVNAGAGDDLVFGGRGNDAIDGGEDTDSANYADAPSGIVVNMSPTVAGRGTVLDGNGGTDQLTNIEVIIGSSFGDAMTGGIGNEVFAGGAGSDAIDGGDGTDRVDYVLAPAAIIANLAVGQIQDGYGGTDTVFNVEDVTGSGHSDIIQGSAADNVLVGGGGNDRLIGLGGADTLDGGAGIDAVDYLTAAGIDVDLATGVARDGFGAEDTLIGIENVIGSGFADVIRGDGGNNRIEGRGGDDQVFGGEGGDNISGSAGTDLLDGGQGSDFVNYSDAPSGVIVDLTTGAAQDGFGSIDTLVSIENIVGSDHDDTLIGDATANRIEGRDGDDIIIGNGGGDILDGFAGNDEMHVSDTVFFARGDVGQDTLVLDGSFDLDLRVIAQDRVLSVERIDITGTGNNTLSLAFEDVFDMTGEVNIEFADAAVQDRAVVITGDTGDTVELEGAAPGNPGAGGSWQAAGQTAIDGQSHNVFNFVDNGTALASVAVESAVTTNVL